MLNGFKTKAVIPCIFVRNRASCSGAQGRLSLWVFHTYLSMYQNQMQQGKRKNFLPLSQNCCDKWLFKSTCTSQDSAFALLICLLALIFIHLFNLPLCYTHYKTKILALNSLLDQILQNWKRGMWKFPFTWLLQIHPEVDFQTSYFGAALAFHFRS